METPLLRALNEPAISAYEREDVSALPGLRALGAVMALHGIARNGGLVGGAIENLFVGRRGQAVDDAIDGFVWLDLDDVAELIARARDAYLLSRPTGSEDLSDDDAALWEQLDAAFFDIAPSARLEVAVTARLQAIAPELGSS
ncbi:DMP19 family protein [Aquipuribacter hungaricus]|uniref:DNA mimic protein DMP19 C-terminal domain-containing protein n=1 Tax=Aquipuribacter hungaricus TaxID=545624 RepID=A0ABV7WLH3_9MICO